MNNSYIANGGGAINQQENHINDNELSKPNDIEADKRVENGKVNYKVDENEERGNWSGQFDFFLSCVGYAVGLGNVWRFPYLCYENGGGAFLIPYFICLLIIGLPMFFLELSFGQFSNNGFLTLWRVSPMFKGVGYTMLIVSVIVSIYYNVVITWSLMYLFKSFTTKLPWSDCSNPWNDDLCIMNFRNATRIPCNSTLKVNCTRYEVPAEQYWNRVVLGLHSYTGEVQEMSPNMGNIQWPLALCLLLAWVICTGCLIKGVKSSGKVVYFTAVFPFVYITIMVIYGFFLEGAMDGIRFYIIPKWEKLQDPKVWGAAATQIFYSLGVGFGGLLTMSSYNRFHNNCLRDAILVAIINCFTSVFAGFGIFAGLGFIAHKTGRSVEETATKGSGLAFVVYAQSIANMPAAPFWSVMFFLMLLTLGVDSQFGGMEAIFSGLQDEYPWLRKSRRNDVLFKIGISVIMYFLGLPLVTQSGMYLFTILDSYSGTYSLIVICLGELVALQYFYGFRNVCKDIKMMLGKSPNYYWLACWIFVTPVVVLLILVLTLYKFRRTDYNGKELPLYADIIGLLIVLFTILPIPVYFVYRLISKGFSRNPTEDWGPGVKSHWLLDERYASKLPPNFEKAGNEMEQMEPNVIEIVRRSKSTQDNPNYEVDRF